MTDKEWKIMETLWSSGGMTVGAITDAVEQDTHWSAKTVSTYLTRMMEKRLVSAKGTKPKVYRALIERDECVANERSDLLERVYRGSAGKLVVAFVKDGCLTRQERDELRRLLDEMEV